MMKNPLLLLLLVLASAARLLCAAPAEGEWSVVPGKSIGKVALGMKSGELHRLLGAPHRQDDLEYLQENAGKDQGLYPLKDSEKILKQDWKDVLREDWIVPLPLPKKEAQNATSFMCDFVTVYTRAEKVVQIEVRVTRFKTPDGLSIANKAAEFEKRYPHFKSWHFHYPHPSAGGIPAGKHFLNYGDAVEDGIAWMCSGFGNLSPEFDPNEEEASALIAHLPGKPILLDPDAYSRFIWKAYPFPGE